MIFVDTGFFFAQFAAEEKERHRKANELLDTLAGESLPHALVTTDHKRHADKNYSAVDCLSFVVMLKRGIQEAWGFDEHFRHRFIVRPGPD